MKRISFKGSFIHTLLIKKDISFRAHSSKNLLSLKRVSRKRIYHNSNGIALINIIDKKLVRIIKGYSIGFMSKSIRNKYIIFSTNKGKTTNKNDQIRLIKDLGVNNQNNSLNIVCSIPTHFSGITELKPNNIQNKNNLYFAISSNRELYIISILFS